MELNSAGAGEGIQHFTLPAHKVDLGNVRGSGAALLIVDAYNGDVAVLIFALAAEGHPRAIEAELRVIILEIQNRA